MFFKRAGDREKQYKQQYGKASPSVTSSTASSTASSGGGILSSLGSIGGSLLSGLGSIGGSLLSVGGSILGGIGSLIGGVAGGIFSIISGALGGLGPLGIILGAAAGFMIYSIAKSIDFEKMGTDFKKIYTDVSTSIKSFFGIEGGGDKKGLLTVFAESLDKTFKTTMFTDTLDKMTKIMESAFNKITDVTIGSLNFISGALVALANDMKGHFLQFLDEYGGYMIAAAAGGGALALGGGAGLGKAAKGGAKALLGMSRFLIANPPLAVAAAALGVTAYGLSELAPTDQDRLTKHLPEERKKLQENLKKTGGMFGGELDPTQRAFAEKRLIELDEEEKALLAKAKELEKKREERRTDHFSRYVESNSIPKEIGKVEQARSAREARTEFAKTDERRTDVSPSQTNGSDENSRKQIEAYLGKAISDKEYDAFLKAVGAEAGSDPMERAAVGAVILNRAKKLGGDGASIIKALNAPKQFQSITGPDGKSGTVDNPWSKNATKLIPGIEKQIADNIGLVPKGLDSFTSAIPSAYKAVGGQAKYDEKMAEMTALGGKKIGQSIFANGGISVAQAGGTNSARTQVAAAQADVNAASAGAGEKPLFSPEDLAAFAAALRAPTMQGAGGGQVLSVEKATPYERDFYQGVVRTVAL